MLNRIIFYFEKIYNFAVDYFFIGFIPFLLFIKNVFIKIQNSIFPQNMRDKEKMLRNNILISNHLQLRSPIFFHSSYVFPFIHEKRFYKNQKFNFSAKIYKIQKKRQETTFYNLKRSTTLLLAIFL